MNDEKLVTVKVDSKLRQSAKIKAAQLGTTISDVVRLALAEFVATGKLPKGDKPIRGK